VDPFCCNVRWDALCVEEVTTVAEISCDPCESHNATGAWAPQLPNRNAIAECVCPDDPFCCDFSWDSLCVSNVENFGCGICPDACPEPAAPLNPIPLNGAVDVRTDTLLSWGCTMADDFEDQDIVEYTVLGGTHTVTAAAAHDGFFGLDSAGSGWIYRDDPAALVAQGETISFWVRPISVEGRAYAGFGASAAGTYSVIAAPNTDEFLIQRNSGFGFVDIGSSPQTWLNQWYRIEVEWGSGGQIVARLYDSDGTTLLNEASALDNTFNAGGIAFRGFNGSKYFDSVQVCASPIPEVSAISQALKDRFNYARDNQLIKAPATDGRQVWDEANQGYVSVSAAPAAKRAAAVPPKVPEGYHFQEGILVEGAGVPMAAPDAVAPSQRSVSSKFIDFDDQEEPCGFASTTRLTDRYAALGVIFEGPGGNDGGAILDECGNFSVSGQSSPNFLAFNSNSQLEDGGVPRGPETIWFQTAVSEVQINAGSNSGAGQSITMEAFDAGSNLVASATITLASNLQPIKVSAERIVRVVISTDATVFVLDDLTWAQWCPVVYDVFFGTAGPTDLICTNVVSPFCDPGPLEEDTTYFWQVVAKSPGGETPGAQWSFTTGIYCACDLNQDGGCNGLDWLLFFPDWNREDCNAPGADPCECDLNGDGACNGLDWLLFFPDWNRTDCSKPSQRCEPQVCGEYTFDCNPENPSCGCVKTAEGLGSCVAGESCPQENECDTSADCPAGSICAVETCCSVNLCVVDNNCAPASADQLETPVAEGPTIFGQ
jgi:hypothetical protein